MGAVGVWGLALLAALTAAPANAQYRKIGEMELRLSGLSATVENAEPVVPKNTPGGIRILISAGGVDLSRTDLHRFLGDDFSVRGEISGPGLSQPVALPALGPGELLPGDPLILPIPPLTMAGNYLLSNLRIVAGGRTVLDVDPASVPLKVIDQILVTQVTTRALTLDEIRGKGIVLDSDDYLGFEFTMGFKLDSKAIDLKFPVVFDRQGVAVPQPLAPPPTPSREAFSLPTIVPLLLEAEGPNGEREELKFTTPTGQVKPITIPAVLVIPGNVGYLKQFFSAQLYVSNGAPVGSGLNVRDIRATLKLPQGILPGPEDDPLSLPDLQREGRVVSQALTADVRGAGPDGVPATEDDVNELAPAEQAQVEFLIEGEKEGFHQIDFDLSAQLFGLPIGPVTVKGKAAGGVLVRNPFFSVTFTVPSIARAGEKFLLQATVTNIGKGIANSVSMNLDQDAFGNLTLKSNPSLSISTLKPGDAAVLDFEFESHKTGKVVATYLKMEGGGSEGNIKFRVGVGERNVPLSPDTLVLPTSTDSLPDPVVKSAMRVLGQAWSVANAPSGTLPQGVTRVSGQVVVRKALALAEAGLRVTLGQPADDAIRDVLYDFFSGAPVDPGFDQLLRTTEAGHAFVQAVGGALSNSAMQSGGGPGYEFETARLLASAAPFVSFAWDGARGDLALVDGGGRTSIRATELSAPAALSSQNVASAVLIPLGSDMMLGIVTQPSAAPYRWDFRASESGSGSLAVTFERPDGSFGRASWSGSVDEGSVVRVTTDSGGQATVQRDMDGDGVFETSEGVSVHTLPVDGPRLLAAAVIGPETLDGAGPWGFQVALVFDRVVGEGSAALVSNYFLSDNKVKSARRQLSGRLVFVALGLPEGPYVPTRIGVLGVEDTRGVTGNEASVPLVSRLGISKPGSPPSREIGAVVSGRVLDSDGEPLVGRTVTYAQYPSLTCGAPIPTAGFAAPVTDSLGKFELRYVRQDLCGNPFELFTIDPGSKARRSQSLHVRSPGQEIVADFVMFATGSATGTVRDHLDQPVPGAKVTVLSLTDAQVGGSTLSDSLGRYSVSGITVGPVSVKAGKGNGVGSASGRIDRANVPAVIDVRIDGGAVNIGGIVSTLDDGVSAPAPGALVTYFLNHGVIPQPMAATRTDTLGRYSFTGMPLGHFLIKAQVNSRDSSTVSGLAIDPGQQTPQNIIVQIPPVTALGYIEGRVVMPDGSPAEGVIVGSGDASVLSGIGGAFELPVVPKLSAHVVNATTRDRKRRGQTTVTVAQGGDRATNILITLSSLGTVEFTVLDGLGQPLPGRAVKLLDSRFEPCGRTTATTDAQGRALFQGIGVGAVTGQVVNQGEVIDAARATVSITGEGATGFGILRVETRGSIIEGTVVDRAGQNVLGAEVELRSPAFVQDRPSSVCGMQTVVTHRARTSSTGRFRFTGIHPGRVYITANQPDFAPTPVSLTHDLAPGASEDLELRLVSTIAGKITGMVYEPDGETSAGPGVEVTMNGVLPDVTVVTNSLGAFTFPEIFPQGGYTLTARDPITGLVEQGRIYATAGVDAKHDIRLKGKAKVRVKVETTDGQAVSSAYVTLTEGAYPKRVFEGVLGASNQGVVEFSGVFEGAVSIEVRDPGGRSGRGALTIPTGASSVETTVRVTTTGTVRGRFRRPAGDDTPIPYGTVRLIVGGRLLGQVTTSATDPVGAFEFAYVPAGLFRLEGLDPQSGRTGLATGSIEAEGEVIDLDVRAQAIGDVTGIVTANLDARDGARVELVSGAYTATTTTNPQGVYTIQGVPEGRIVVSADLGSAGGIAFLRGTASGTLLGEGSTLNLNVALRDSGGVKGRVVKAGAGDESAGVVAVSISVGGVGGGVVTGLTDELGEFEFTRVPAGLATITVEAYGSDDFAIDTIEVLSGAEPVEMTLRLNGIGGLAGEAQELPVGLTLRRLTISYGPPERRRGVSLDLPENGKFTLPRILAGPFTATLQAHTGSLVLYGSASGVIENGSTAEVIIRLQESTTVSGRVLRADGVTPAYASAVTLELPATLATSATQAQGDGRFTFRGVPLGAFVVKAVDPVTGGIARATGSSSSNSAPIELPDLILDDSPIQVVSVDPPNGTAGVSVMRPIYLTFSDPLIGATGFSVMNGSVWVGTPAPVLSNGNKTVTINPPGTGWPNPGTLTVVASTVVTDVLGRRLAQAFTSQFTTEDKSPPEPVTFSPSSGAIQVMPSSPITVTFSEPLAMTPEEVAEVIKVSRFGGAEIAGILAFSPPSTMQFQPLSPLTANATYVVVVNGAVDTLGNKQTSHRVITFKTIDTIAPTLSLSPVANSVVANPRPTISVLVTDAISGFDPSTAALSLDGSSISLVATPNGFYHIPPQDLAEGEHVIEAAARDRGSNLKTAVAAFVVDYSTPASVMLTVPASGAVLAGVVPVSAMATDAVSGIDRIEVREGTQVRATLSGPAFVGALNTVPLTEGPHLLHARAFDRAGNHADGPVVPVRVDNHPIVVTITQPTPGSRFKSAATLRATVSEVVQRVDFTLQNVTISDTTSPYEATFDLTSLAESESVLFEVLGTTESGDTAAATVAVAIDRTAPGPVDGNKVFAEAPTGSALKLVSLPGAADPGSVVELHNLATSKVRTTISLEDGSFFGAVPGVLGDTVEIVQLDDAGNRSIAVAVTVSTTSAVSIPTDGLRIWAGADHGVVTEPGGRVSTWSSRSPAPIALSQSVSTARPTLVEDGFQGQPVLRFDGANYLAFPTQASIRSVFMVVGDTSADANQRTILGGAAHFFPGTGEALWSTGASPFVVGGQTRINGGVVNGTVAGRPRKMSIISLITTANTTASVLGSYTGGDRFFKGDVAEILIYDKALTNAERRSVEAYLAAKYRASKPEVIPPAISPSGGPLSGPTLVSLTSETPGASIHFTSDGSAPSTTSPLYEGPIPVEGAASIRAIAVRPTYRDSAESTAFFSSAIMAPPTSNLRMWLRADGFGAESAKPVWRWPDFAVAANDLTQGTVTALPIHVPAAANGLPAVRFDGGDFGRFTSPISDIRTVFWVLRDTSGDSTGRYLFSNADGTPNEFVPGNGEALWSSAASPAIRNGETWVNGVPVNGQSAGRPRQLSVVSLIATANTTADTFGSYGGSNQFFKGDLAEVLVYGTALSASQRRGVESYLMAKYALSPPASPAFGTVNVDVKQGGIAVPGRVVTLTSDHLTASPAERTKVLTTNPSGRVSASMPIGNIVAAVTDGALFYEARTVLVAGQTATLAINLPAVPTSLAGTVYASNGISPLQGATVSVGSKQATTDTLGHYLIDFPATGSQSLVITYQGAADHVQATITAGVQNAVNHVHSAAHDQIVTVTDALTGAAVQGASVVACAQVGPATCSAPRGTDAAGEVRYIGLPTGLVDHAGDYEITATTADGRAQSMVVFLSPYSPAFVTVPVNSPGRVRGTVLFATGGAAAGVDVSVTDSTGSVWMSQTAAPDGTYSFQWLGGRDVTIRAIAPDGLAEAASSVAVPVGGDVIVDLTIPIAQLEITLVDDLGQPLAGEALDITILGPYTFNRVTDSSGRASLTLPSGFTQVIGLSPDFAAQEFELVAGETRVITLTAGSHHPPRALGAFNLPGSSEGVVYPAQFGFYRAVERPVFQSTTSAEGESAERVAGYDESPWTRTLVYFKQKFFVPTSGAFARSLTLFTNPADEEVTVNLEAPLGAYGDTVSSLESATVDGGYSVVFGRSSVNCSDGCRIQQTLTIPPRSTKGLLVFTTMDPATIPALRNLTATSAVAELSQAEREAIVNFDVPSPITAVIQGSAQSASGDTLAGATVAVGREGVLVAQGTTDAFGAFSFSFSGLSGTYRVVFVHGDQVFQATFEILASGTFALGPIQALDPSERGDVLVLLEDGTQASVGGLTVSGRNAGFLGLDTAVVVATASDGTGLLQGLIPGLNEIQTPIGSAYARVVSGRQAPVRLRRGDGPARVEGRVTLDGRPVPGAVVVATQWDALAEEDVVIARATTNGLGRYVLLGLRDGEGINLYAWDPDANRHASSWAYMPSGVLATEVEGIPLASDDSVGSLRVRVAPEAGGPLPGGHTVTLKMQSWPFSMPLDLDASGEATVFGLPGGNSVLVSVTGSSGFGRELGTLVSQEQVVLSVPVGARLPLPAELTPFTFSGVLLSEVPGSCIPFCEQGWVVMDGAQEPWDEAGSATVGVTAAGRELTVQFRVSPQGGLSSSLRLVRRLFVPTDGRFARLIDVVENVGALPATASYSSNPQSFAAAGAVAEVFGDGVIDVNDHAFILQSDQPTGETTAFIMRGVGSPAPQTAQVDDQGFGQDAVFTWEGIDLDPGQRKAFMRFVVFDRGPAASEVATRMQALLALSDPDALHGLSAGDRALIVNWILP